MEHHFCSGEPNNGKGWYQEPVLALDIGGDVHATCMRDHPMDAYNRVVCEYRCACCCNSEGAV